MVTPPFAIDSLILLFMIRKQRFASSEERNYSIQSSPICARIQLFQCRHYCMLLKYNSIFLAVLLWSGSKQDAYMNWADRGMRLFINTIIYDNKVTDLYPVSVQKLICQTDVEFEVNDRLIIFYGSGRWWSFHRTRPQFTWLPIPIHTFSVDPNFSSFVLN